MDEKKIIDKAKEIGSDIDDFVEEKAEQLDKEADGKLGNAAKVIIWVVIAGAVYAALSYFGVVK